MVGTMAKKGRAASDGTVLRRPPSFGCQLVCVCVRPTDRPTAAAAAFSRDRARQVRTRRRWRVATGGVRKSRRRRRRPRCIEAVCSTRPPSVAGHHGGPLRATLSYARVCEPFGGTLATRHHFTLPFVGGPSVDFVYTAGRTRLFAQFTLQQFPSTR